MELKREKIIAYCAAIVLFVVGMVCYAALPEKQPEEPVRIMFQSTGGKVLFTHNIHTSEDNYGFYCIDCHHYWDEDPDVKPVSCSECHMTESEEEDIPKRSDALHDQCMGCHEDNWGGPVECSGCHVL
jgi:hypothetical protein